MFTITVCFDYEIYTFWLENYFKCRRTIKFTWYVKNINNNSTLDLFYEKLHLTEREQEIFHYY